MAAVRAPDPRFQELRDLLDQRWQELAEEQAAQQEALKVLLDEHGELRQELKLLRQAEKQHLQARNEPRQEEDQPCPGFNCSHTLEVSCHTKCTEAGLSSRQTTVFASSEAEGFDEEGGTCSREVTKSATEAEEDGDYDQEHYTFSESVWSAAILVCTPSIGRLGSVMMIFLVVLTMVTQLLFCCVVLNNFTSRAYDQSVVDGFQAWRTSVGHNLRYMDDISGMSLASRVCSSTSNSIHAALELSTEQASHVDQIRAYLPSLRRDQSVSFGDAFTSGPVLCTFVLFCYYAILAKEFQDIVRMLWATAIIPHRSCTASCNSGHLSYLSRQRFVFLVVTAGFRALVAGMLAWAGTLFIVQTVDMRDLLLQAMTLGFVLDIDEILYACLAPVRVRYMVSRMEPLPLRSQGQKKSYGWSRERMSFITAIFLLLSIVVAVLLHLQPLIGELRKAEATLCGGQQDFVYAVDGRGTVSWADSSSTKSEQGNYLTAAVAEVIQGEDDGLSRFVTTVPTLRERNAQTVADAADEERCAGEDLTRPSMALLQEILHDSAITSCQDVASYCDDDGMVGVRVRQACPSVCGCNNLTQPLWYKDPLRGCGHTCPDTSTWKTVAPWPCVDVPVEKLRDTYGSFLEVLRKYPSKKDLAGLFQKQGCGAVAVAHVNFSQRLCVDPNLRPTLLAFCPESCGCKLAPQSGCPMFCFKSMYGQAIDTIMGNLPPDGIGSMLFSGARNYYGGNGYGGNSDGGNSSTRGNSSTNDSSPSPPEPLQSEAVTECDNCTTDNATQLDNNNYIATGEAVSTSRIPATQSTSTRRWKKWLR